jgi:hypothetical protein
MEGDRSVRGLLIRFGEAENAPSRWPLRNLRVWARVLLRNARRKVNEQAKAG